MKAQQQQDEKMKINVGTQGATHPTDLSTLTVRRGEGKRMDYEGPSKIWSCKSIHTSRPEDEVGNRPAHSTYRTT